MGQMKSKLKKPNNPVDKLVYNEQLRRQKEDEKAKRIKQLEKNLEKNKKKLKNKTKNNKNEIKNEEKIINNPSVETKNFRFTFRMEDYDHHVRLYLEDQIKNMFANFCLNQIVLSMQFFGNFQSEKSSGIEEILKKEADQNQYLDKHSILLPNALDEGVQKRIQYKPKHGPDKNILSELQLQTMYVIFENVEISKPDDANYDSINPICKVDIDTKINLKKKFKGYLRLKLRETSNSSKSKSKHSFDIKVNNFSDSSNDSYLRNNNYYDDYIEKNNNNNNNNNNRNNNYLNEPQYDTIKVTRHSNSSGIDVAGSEYAYITSLNTHQLLSELSISNKLKSEIFNAKIVPESCITILQQYVQRSELNMANDDDDDDDSDSEEEEEEYIEVKYLNSKSFFCYFATVLKDHLANDLNLEDVEFDNATWKGASIFTKSYEIIPAIHVQLWPDCAFEWLQRKRSVCHNPLNGQRFQWPTHDMIKKVESFGCHVIPMGYAPKTKKNPYRELEWKIVFPKAERYLEENLTDTQVKIFMIAKVLVKTFLEQKRDIFMFTMDHLRMHLFWEVEKNYGAWPEEFLGEVLLRFLRSFLEKTSSKCLQDFFITGRNLFECIPESTLYQIHAIISQIVQNPVFHLLAAYRNLEQDQEYFPKLNYRKLYQIITVDNILTFSEKLNTRIRPNVNPIFNDRNDDKNEDLLLVDELDEDNVGLIAYSYKQDLKRKSRKSKRLKKQSRVPSMRNNNLKNTKHIKRVSIDSIDLKQYIFTTNLDDLRRAKGKIDQLDDMRRALVIEMFVKQFIHQAKLSYNHKSLDKTRIYLNQAGRLCSFLLKLGYDMSANNLLVKINKLKNKYGSQSMVNSISENPPALPERTSMEPVKSFRSDDLSNNSPYVQRRNHDFSNDEMSPTRKQKVRSVHYDEENSFEPRSFLVDDEMNQPRTSVFIRTNSSNSTTKYHENSNKIQRGVSFKETSFESHKKQVQIVPKPFTLQKSKNKMMKQVSTIENANIRKSILKTNNKDNSPTRFSNGILKQTSLDSNSFPYDSRENSYAHNPYIDDRQYVSRTSESSISSETEETGLTFKEVFERRRNNIQRKFIPSLILKDNDKLDSDHGNSTDL